MQESNNDVLLARLAAMMGMQQTQQAAVGPNLKCCNFYVGDTNDNSSDTRYCRFGAGDDDDNDNADGVDALINIGLNLRRLMERDSSCDMFLASLMPKESPRKAVAPPGYTDDWVDQACGRSAQGHLLHCQSDRL